VDFTPLPERKLVTIPNKRSRPQFHPFSCGADNVIAVHEDTSFIYAMQVSWGSAPLPYGEPGSEFPNEDRDSIIRSIAFRSFRTPHPRKALYACTGSYPAIAKHAK
jgi:hypothetical protein